jgi:hypothetical protein
VLWELLGYYLICDHLSQQSFIYIYIYIHTHINTCYRCIIVAYYKLYLLLEMKETWKKQRDSSKTSTGFIVQEEAWWRGTPARKLEPPATYRLDVDIREWYGGETPLDGKILPQ